MLVARNTSFNLPIFGLFKHCSQIRFISFQKKNYSVPISKIRLRISSTRIGYRYQSNTTLSNNTPLDTSPVATPPDEEQLDNNVSDPLSSPEDKAPSDVLASFIESLPLVGNKRTIKINSTEYKETFVKGSGNGGQKINKTNSCVQLLHIPSGIVVQVSIPTTAYLSISPLITFFFTNIVPGNQISAFQPENRHEAADFQTGSFN
ncbi:putative peptide chain release factor C12orf65-like protein [Smittium mucronatum]|uniref:Putative peptide chain release factor C12orf65-like protein n=1 Tax=Smittium mucronatum TaxID=133383 RepID=A0A1R0GZC5_9FUNG|nr:putative peptide chain release factor C12orf65-like protein [Smittium mucronatum]